MNNNSFSRFRNIRSPIHSIDPITKIIAFLFIEIAIFFAQSLGPLLIVILFIFVISILSRIRFVTYFRLLFLIVPFFILMTLMYMLFSWSIDPQILEFTGQMSLRFYGLVLLAIILTYTTKEMEIASGIEFLIRPLRIIKVPTYEISIIIMLAIRFIPLILGDLHKIMIAQTSRGVNVINGGKITKIKGALNSLLPMIVISFRRADDFSSAMTIRGYKINKKRTKLRKTTFSFLEITTLIIVLLLFTTTLYLQFADWGNWI